MLYGLSDAGVPTDAVIAGARPLHLTQKAPHGQQHPNGDPLEVEDALFDNGGEYIITNIQDYYADWPYNGGKRPTDFTTYLDIVETVVTSVCTESDHPEKYVFVPFNEPDGGNWYGNWSTMRSTFLADWKAAYETIEATYAATCGGDATIAGPGDTGWQATRTRDILAYAKANDVVPDMFTWHELGRGSLASFRSHLAQYRAIEADLGIAALPVNITEYAMRRDMSVPGQMVQWLAMFEDEKVDAQTAYWTYAGNLNDNSAKSNGANGAWWLLSWYGGLTGDTVQVTPPRLDVADTLQGIATVDGSARRATVLYGGTGSDVRLDVSGIDLDVFTGEVDVQVREAEWSGQEGEATAPPVVAAQRLAVVDGEVSLTVPGGDRLSAYQVVITPALAEQPEVDGTWRAQIEAEDTALTAVTAYNQSATDDWVFAASGARDVGSTNKVTSKLDWSVSVPRSGTYRLGVTAGVNGPAIGPGRHAVFVDGVYAAMLEYEPGFAWSYRGRTEVDLTLPAGAHTISVRMSRDGSTLLPGSDISLDKFDLTEITGPETTTYPAALARLDRATVAYDRPEAAGAVALTGEATATIYAAVRDTGYYDLAVAYRSDAAADVDLVIDGRTVAGLAAGSAGAWQSTARVHLAAGVHELVLGSQAGILLSGVTTTRAVEGDAAAFFTEAEDATRVTRHGAVTVDTIAQPTNVSGRSVGYIGNGAANYLTLARPAGMPAGDYDLVVRYANAAKNTGHAYNTDVISRFLDITEAGGTTTRGAFRHNYSWNGFWTQTVPVQLTTGTGSLALGNTTGWAPNIDWLRLAPFVLSVGTQGQAAPTIELAAASSAPAVDGWFGDDVTVQATVVDEPAGATQTLVEHSTDGVAWTAGAEVTVAAEGLTSVRFRATGAAGLTTEAALDVRLDRTAPVSAATVDAGVVRLSAVDAASGVARIEYRTAAQDAWTDYTDPVAVGAEVASVQYRAVDAVGNVEGVREVVLAAAWSATGTYPAGATVEHRGAVWVATWWTNGQQPGDPTGPWQEQAVTPDGSVAWTASRVFVAGDEVVHEGERYRAAWWTRNQVPGDPHGPWTPLG
jgi:chitodextrinase